jgi:hypothetical protein
MGFKVHEEIDPKSNGPSVLIRGFFFLIIKHCFSFGTKGFDFSGLEALPLSFPLFCGIPAG